MAIPSQPLRTPTQLLKAFAAAAAKFPACPRMLAFPNAAREDGLVTVPASLLPRKPDGQPVIGQLNIGGPSKTVFPGIPTFYGIGGANIATENGDRNVGFLLYGANHDDEAVSVFRKLGSEAGVVVHVHDLVPGIENYDTPLVLWSVVIYATLQGSGWLTQIDGIAETPALHFSPFTASVAALKRLIAQRPKRRDDPLPREPGRPADSSDPVPSEGRREAEAPSLPSESAALAALMRLYTNGVADGRIRKAAWLLSAPELNTNDKLTKIDALLPLPATASAEQLGELLGVSKQAILKTEWWIHRRRGEKKSEIGRRREGHRKRAGRLEALPHDNECEQR